MASGCINIYNSRRVFHTKCLFWKKDIGKDISILKHKDNATGVFYCKEVNSYNVSDNIVGGAIAFDNTTITIETRDDVSNLDHDDIVLLNDNYYIVENVQKTKVARQSEFVKRPQYTYFIALRGA